MRVIGESLFADKNYSFQDILHGKKAGGLSNISSYLSVRIKQMTRVVTTSNMEDSDRMRALLSIQAMSEAQKILLRLRPD